MADVLATVPAPVTAADRIVLEIRKFIASAIFFNTQAAEKVGLSLTDMQMMHMLQLYGPATPGRLAKWSGLSTGGVTVALDRLQKAGYIRREPNPADRRAVRSVSKKRITASRSLEGKVASSRRVSLSTSP